MGEASGFGRQLLIAPSMRLIVRALLIANKIPANTAAQNIYVSNLPLKSSIPPKIKKIIAITTPSDPKTYLTLR
jgi:hypothetical protein